MISNYLLNLGILRIENQVHNVTLNQNEKIKETSPVEVSWRVARTNAAKELFCLSGVCEAAEMG